MNVWACDTYYQTVNKVAQGILGVHARFVTSNVSVFGIRYIFDRIRIRHSRTVRLRTSFYVQEYGFIFYFMIFCRETEEPGSETLPAIYF